ncbi:MAG TPA: thioredoxin [Vicinamibacterales bacterium]|nr:thioredoxin [Vicinamibacterales bacterium]
MSAAQLDDRGIVTTCPACGQRNRFLYERLDHTVRCGKCKTALAPPAEPIEIGSSAEFDRLIARASVPVLVDYWAPWCGPCRMVAPEVKKVAAHRAGRALVVKVNTDVLADLGQRFGVRSIPTLAIFADGREVTRSAGARPAAEIEGLLDQVVSTSHS